MKSSWRSLDRSVIIRKEKHYSVWALQKYRIGEGVMSGFLPLILNTFQLHIWGCFGSTNINTILALQGVGSITRIAVNLVLGWKLMYSEVDFGYNAHTNSANFDCILKYR